MAIIITITFILEKKYSFKNQFCLCSSTAMFAILFDFCPGPCEEEGKILVECGTACPETCESLSGEIVCMIDEGFECAPTCECAEDMVEQDGML